MSRTVRTRFAPSPSGHLHVGGARTALFCWAYARKHGGKFILRIEDTDRKRSSDAASTAFMDDLKWLGLEWDEGPAHEGCGGGDAGPYLQSQRLEIYQEHIQRLLDEGKAYRAFDTPEELDASRAAAREAKQNYRYDRAALKIDAATREQWASEGKPHVVRLKVPDEGVNTFHDEIRGDVTVDALELDDFVIRKADGYPTYHFAVVVDDELMGVTHVVRAEEHLKNTHKHVLLQEALGFDRPCFAHISVITNPDGSKMSKRDKDKALKRAVKEQGVDTPPTLPHEPEPVLTEHQWTWWRESKDHQLDIEHATRLADALNVHLPEINIDDFRRAGYLPEVLINYLALLGWNPGGDVEKFDAAFIVEHFDFDRVQKSAAKFDRDKLLAFNLDALQALTPDEFVARFRAHCVEYHDWFIGALPGDQFDLLARANQARSKTLDDPIESCRFFVVGDDEIVYEQSKAVRKALVNGEPNGYTHLEGIAPVLGDLSDWTVDAIDTALRAYAEAHADGKLGKVAQPLRIAVSGGTISPDINSTLAILGRDSTLNRIERCLGHRETIAS